MSPDISDRFTSEQLKAMFEAKEKVFCRDVGFGSHMIDLIINDNEGMRKPLGESDCIEFVAHLYMAAAGCDVNYIMTADDRDPFEKCLGLCTRPKDGFVGIYMGNEGKVYLAGFRREQLTDEELLSITAALCRTGRGTA